MFEEEILTYSAVVEVENFSGSDIVLFFIIIVVLGVVHCSIFKGSYNISNISYLNSPLPLLSFILPPLDIALLRSQNSQNTTGEKELRNLGNCD
jgi:hypothetical protein